jgi:hypothetical protein
MQTTNYNDMSRFQEHRTLTIEIWAVEGFDFDAVKSDIESALEQHANAGNNMDWNITAEG